MNKAIASYLGRTNGKHVVLDYHECESVEDLVVVLNEVAQSGFFLERVIPTGNAYVVMFRRPYYG